MVIIYWNKCLYNSNIRSKRALYKCLSRGTLGGNLYTISLPTLREVFNVKICKNSNVFPSICIKNSELFQDTATQILIGLQDRDKRISHHTPSLFHKTFPSSKITYFTLFFTLCNHKFPRAAQFKHAQFGSALSLTNMLLFFYYFHYNWVPFLHK